MANSNAGLSLPNPDRRENRWPFFIRSLGTNSQTFAMIATACAQLVQTTHASIRDWRQAEIVSPAPTQVLPTWFPARNRAICATSTSSMNSC